MSEHRVYNFSAGPSMLPLPVLERAAAEMTDYNGTGMSVMEMSHRSKIYLEIFDSTMDLFRKLMCVPDNYKVLFLQGGATTQFAMVPMNLMYRSGKADYAVTGSFAGKARDEAQKYGKVNIAFDTKPAGHNRIPSQEELVLDPEASYFYYCANNTIYGTEWQYVPETGDVPVVCDMSSDILSRVVDVSKYGIIFAGAQKNMAGAGLTVVIIREDLAGHALPYTPVMLDYEKMIKGDSMHNTPPTYNIYILGLVLKWLEEQGGIAGMEKIKSAKAKLLYDVLDSSKLYIPHAQKDSRSDMNVTFRTGSEELDDKFVKEAAAQGLVNLKGHRSTGGMRASIYNAMPIEGVEKLAAFMRDFEARHI
ncbi:MAG: 3-phosphoserine/phosphohydroxythreonine transaminase [Oscillospiraceae bacterium]|jgi:phosphoserine aminotransferase